jgi:ABC-2 type transport system ATP-binding protein
MEATTIETRRLTRTYGELIAVQDLGLRVERGSVYGFLGPNGAGKTTTIRMLLGLIRPDAGEVRLFGAPLRTQKRACLSRIGALVESPSLYPHLTGRDNLEVTRRLTGASKANIDRALTTAHMTDAADRKVRTYSLGMRQRLALALALLNEPELLILDEPTNGLDPAGIREVRELICELPAQQGITVFLSSHLLAEVEQVATHIGILQHGRLRFQGTLDALHAHVENRVTLGVDQPERATAALRRAGWAAHRNGNGHIWAAVNGKADAALVNAQLVREGINIYHLSIGQPTLEDIFLQVTGVDETEPKHAARL